MEKKRAFLYILIIAFISAVLIYFLFSSSIENLINDNVRKAGQIKTEEGHGDNPAVNVFESNGKANKIIDKSENELNNEGSGTGSGVGGKAGETSSSSGIINSTNQDSTNNDFLCLLARPGNLPNIECHVNYIKTDSISLKISNALGEDIFVEIIIDGCSSNVQGFVKNNENTDFVINCSVENYFESELTMIYSIGNNNIVINGIVSGYALD